MIGVAVVVGVAMQAAPVDAPRPATTGPTGPVLIVPLVPAEAPPRRRGLVFAFMPGLTFGVSRLPSLNLAFFFGGRLRGRAWALGYQITGSSGGAERYIWGTLTHRHHVTAMRPFGATGRGLVTVGGGLAFLVLSPVVEAEARVAWRFGERRRGLLGLVARLGWNVGYDERAPMPQLGVVFGAASL